MRHANVDIAVALLQAGGRSSTGGRAEKPGRPDPPAGQAVDWRPAQRIRAAIASGFAFCSSPSGCWAGE